MGIKVVGLGSRPEGEEAKQLAFRQKVAAHLHAVCTGILQALSEAAADDAGRDADSDLERTTWHLQMACNYLKLIASETSFAEADAVDGVRDRLNDRLFLLEAALLSVGRGGTLSRAEGLFEGLELMVAISSLLPPDAALTQPKSEQGDDLTAF